MMTFFRRPENLEHEDTTLPFLTTEADLASSDHAARTTNDVLSCYAGLAAPQIPCDDDDGLLRREVRCILPLLIHPVPETETKEDTIIV